MAREMKDSGIEWVGEIPNNWRTCRICAIASTEKESINPKDAPYSLFEEFSMPAYDTGNSPQIVQGENIDSSRTLLRKNAILVNKLNVNKERIWDASISNEHTAVCSSEFVALYPREVLPRYLYYVLKNPRITNYLISLSTGTTNSQRRINPLDIYHCVIPMPHGEIEQHHIVSFLDSKCAEIDKAVEATKASIEEYKKLRQAIITEAVTKGLDPNVEMKDSGIEWIGEIPATWTSMPTKNMFLIGKGLSITKDNLEETGVPTISYGQIHAKYNTGTHLDDRMFRYVNESYLQSNKQSLVHKGCFVFADTSEDLEGCGNCVYADREGEFFAGYHTVTLFPKECEDNKYFAYLFRTNEWRRQIRSVLTEVKVYSVSQKIIRRTSIIIPPESEQKEICSYLDTKCAEIDSLIKSKEKLIEELTAYRKSLIFEYVTGKKEVPAV